MGDEKGLSVHRRDGNPHTSLVNRSGAFWRERGSAVCPAPLLVCAAPTASPDNGLPPPRTLPLSKWALPSYWIGVKEGRTVLLGGRLSHQVIKREINASLSMTIRKLWSGSKEMKPADRNTERWRLEIKPRVSLLAGFPNIHLPPEVAAVRLTLLLATVFLDSCPSLCSEVRMCWLAGLGNFPRSNSSPWD